MNIRTKLVVNAAITLLSLLIIFALQLYSNETTSNLKSVLLDTSTLKADLLETRILEKDFISQNSAKLLEAHTKKLNDVIEQSKTLEADFGRLELDTAQIHKLTSALNDYLDSSTQVVDLKKEIGLSPEQGLRGQLRTAAHKLESQFKAHPDQSTYATLLQMRRAEKDFLIRHSVKYAKLNKSLALDLAEKARADGAAGELALINEYKETFTALVEAETQLGLGLGKGLLAELTASADNAQKALSLVEQTSHESIDNTEHNQVIMTAIIFSLVALILGSFTFYMATSIIKGITQITETLEQIKDTKDLSIKCDSSDDELGKIGASINTTFDSFIALLSEVLSSVGQVRHSSEQLTEHATTTSDGVAQQLQETDMVATAITEMGATIDKIAQNTELAAERAEKTHSNAQDGLHSVEQTITKIQSLAEKLTQSADVVNELEKDSETIGTVLDVIRGIAEQTNLLALNAAIEAARAGEQGRGFAVVADEVRNLAMRTQESTEEISRIIDTLQSRTKSVVDLMAETQEQGADSSQQAASAGELLQQINVDVTEILDMNTQIAAAIEEQSVVANEVNKNVSRIRDVAQETADTSSNSAKLSSELEEQCLVLSESANQFKTS